jgi:hypothetical protein
MLARSREVSAVEHLQLDGPTPSYSRRLLCGFAGGGDFVRRRQGENLHSVKCTSQGQLYFSLTSARY